MKHKSLKGANMSKTILITGASTGFGRDTAETLAKAGHTVYASMRDPNGKNKNHADELSKQGIKVVDLDVTSDASVDKAVSEVLKSAGKIDVPELPWQLVAPTKN
jgi:NAD(P)-dependent dehydrogenase (short-subunit alcohol dehydrogenase family)